MKIKFCLFCVLSIAASFAFASDQANAQFDGSAFGSIIENKAVPFESSAQLQQRMSAGRLTSAELVQGLLRRIEALNRNGPQLNAAIEVNPDALQIAAHMDAERSRGEKTWAAARHSRTGERHYQHGRQDNEGLPKGLHFLSTAWDEANLPSYAYALEQVLVAASATSTRSTVPDQD